MSTIFQNYHDLISSCLDKVYSILFLTRPLPNFPNKQHNKIITINLQSHKSKCIQKLTDILGPASAFTGESYQIITITNEHNFSCVWCVRSGFESITAQAPIKKKWLFKFSIISTNNVEEGRPSIPPPVLKTFFQILIHSAINLDFCVKADLLLVRWTL